MHTNKKLCGNIHRNIHKHDIIRLSATAPSVNNHDESFVFRQRCPYISHIHLFFQAHWQAINSVTVADEGGNLGN